MIKRKNKILFISILTGLMLIQCVNIEAQGVKKCEFCGSFYPKNKLELSGFLDEILKNTPVEKIDGEIIGLIVPHAGYEYSAKVAAYAYKLLEDKTFDTVIILAPSHQRYLNGIAIYPDSGFETPIGDLKTDKEITEAFKSLKFSTINKDYFSNEHSIEVQLPFIIRTLKSTKIVPIVMGSMDYADLQKLSEAIREISFKKHILLVASSDLSHFNTYDEAVKIDSGTIDYIKDNDFDYLWTSEEYSERRACGIYPIISLLMYSKALGADVKILKYSNSGDVTLNKDRVVGYVSAVIYKNNSSDKTQISGKSDIKEAKMSEFVLTDDEKKELLKIARVTLESYLKTGKKPVFKNESKTLQEKRGAFVTLKAKGQLRGCIGRIVADMALYRVISDTAIDSAVNDSRFEPVIYSELKDIEIEISVLTPFEKVKSIEDIEVGKDGLIIKNGFYSGLLLPQVPLEYSWDREMFLEHLCLKAGLPTDSYKNKNTELYKFNAIVFSESELKK